MDIFFRHNILFIKSAQGVGPKNIFKMFFLFDYHIDAYTYIYNIYIYIYIYIYTYRLDEVGINKN